MVGGKKIPFPKKGKKMQLFCVYPAPYCLGPHLPPKSVSVIYLTSVKQKCTVQIGCWAPCLQVEEGADAGGCCNTHCPKNQVLPELLPALASSQGCMGEDFENLLNQICICSLVWRVVIVHVDDSFSRQREYFWKGSGGAPRRQPQGDLVELES